MAVVVEVKANRPPKMDRSSELLVSTLLTGTVASVVSTAALAALAKAEGKRPMNPANSTSHWLHGDSAGSFDGVDVEHTGLGLATHHASAMFWALPFEAWLAFHPPRSSIELARDASNVCNRRDRRLRDCPKTPDAWLGTEPVEEIDGRRRLRAWP